MAARTSSATRPAAAALDRSADFSRQQVNVVAESGSTLLRGMDAMRKIQEQAVQQVMRRHAEAASKLGATPQPGDVLALQAQLLQQDMADTIRCWQELVGEAIEIQTELLGCSARLLNTEDVFAAARFVHA